jgi:hypothetical protein
MYAWRAILQIVQAYSVGDFEFGRRFFIGWGLSISAAKSEVVVFSKKRTEVSTRLTMCGICLPALTEFE